jgi:hypothetical protein
MPWPGWMKTVQLDLEAKGIIPREKRRRYDYTSHDGRTGTNPCSVVHVSKNANVEL